MNKRQAYRKYVLVFLGLLLVFAVGCVYVPDELRSIGAPVVQTFEATPSIINKGDTSVLRWHTYNAQSVHIDNGIGDVATTGTFPVAPSTTTLYTITARNAIGVATARTQVMVRAETIRTTGNHTIVRDHKIYITEVIRSPQMLLFDRLSCTSQSIFG